MELLHLENYPGYDNKVYEIKIISFNSENIVSIYRIDKNDFDKVLIWRFICENPYDQFTEIERAKRSIVMSTMIEREIIEYGDSSDLLW